MEVFHTVQEVRRWRASVRGKVPFVPTMGALHEGHASLMRRAAVMAGSPPDGGAEGGAAAASIFVNPTQFGPQEDFTRYPRTLEADLAMLEAAGCAAVFVPSPAEMYPDVQAGSTESLARLASVEPGPVAETLEGALRPGHFRGVCTVVLKLLNIVGPTHLLLGQKDFQQQAVLRQMCGQLNVPVEVVTCPTMREADGLAMSSRNRYLNPDERARAIALWEALTAAREAYRGGERRAGVLEAAMRRRLEARGADIQYAVVVHAKTLAVFDGPVTPPAVALIAAKVGGTRLIDNLLLDEAP